MANQQTLEELYAIIKGRQGYPKGRILYELLVRQGAR